MELLYGTVKSIVVYFILSTVIMNLLGKSEFKKYVGIFMGMLLILIVIQPFLKLSKLDTQMDYYFQMNEIKTNKKLEEQFDQAQEKQDKSIIEQYEQTIREQTKWILSPYEFQIQRFQLEMEEDIDEENFGEIYNISVSLISDSKQEESQRQENEIKKVQIDPIEIEKKDEIKKKNKKGETFAALQMADIIAQFYHLEKKQVNVVIIDEETAMEGD